jgi:hypothetical protein
MTRSTNFKPDTYDMLSVFERPGDIPTMPRGLPVLRPTVSRRALRPTWIAVALAGIVGTFGGVLIAVLSGPVAG